MEQEKQIHCCSNKIAAKTLPQQLYLTKAQLKETLKETLLQPKQTVPFRNREKRIVDR